MGTSKNTVENTIQRKMHEAAEKVKCVKYCEKHSTSNRECKVFKKCKKLKKR